MKEEFHESIVFFSTEFFRPKLLMSSEYNTEKIIPGNQVNQKLHTLLF